ncbi:hypothetical protein QYM36_008676 [Artemia franciscana]|uniref:Uncharacterized protein n=1 Tax=Artemia franciscana TaxID=6661 RepID=A0AA88L2K9_ARTSF|nr:hypothetical protein QYM36_008676 [Artemia franciscana]
MCTPQGTHNHAINRLNSISEAGDSGISIPRNGDELEMTYISSNEPGYQNFSETMSVVSQGTSSSFTSMTTSSNGVHYDRIHYHRHHPNGNKKKAVEKQAYYRQGVALQCLARHADALAAFSAGLAQDAKSLQLLSGLVEAAMKSPLRASLEPTYRQLQAMRLDKSPFVVISVIGQELLAVGHFQAAVIVLESALRIGTCSLKLRGSVFSALSSAYWALSSVDKGYSYLLYLGPLKLTKNVSAQAFSLKDQTRLAGDFYRFKWTLVGFSWIRWQLMEIDEAKNFLMVNFRFAIFVHYQV